jgi:ubiquinone/menaquinone biosynthesis C-methylase UbiE
VTAEAADDARAAAQQAALAAEQRAAVAAEQRAAVAAAFDNSADSYEQVGVAYFGPLGAELVRRADPRPGSTALDLGCGRGHVLFPLAQAVGPTGRATGVDLSTRMVELCAAEAAARGLDHVRVVEGDAGTPDFPAASFDVVTAGMVMFFVPAPRAAVHRVAGLLRPGGVFGMSSFGPSDPKFAQTMAILYRHRVGPPWEEATDKPFDDCDSIAAMLTQAGFVDVAIGEAEHEIVLADRDQYWAWVASHGGRILIDAVGPERLPAARVEIDTMLTGHQAPDGSLVHRSIARYAIARVQG